MRFTQKLTAILEGDWDPEGPWTPPQYELVRIIAEDETGTWGILRTSDMPPQFYGGKITKAPIGLLPADDRDQNFFKDIWAAESHADAEHVNAVAAQHAAPSTRFTTRFESRLGRALAEADDDFGALKQGEVCHLCRNPVGFHVGSVPNGRGGWAPICDACKLNLEREEEEGLCEYCNNPVSPGEKACDACAEEHMGELGKDYCHNCGGLTRKAITGGKALCQSCRAIEI